MTNNEIKDYKETIGMLEVMIEDASGDEASVLEDALGSLRRAETVVIEEKREAVNALYESGEISDQEYNEYLDYLNENAFEAEKELTPYIETASIGTAITVAEAEKKAFNSNHAKFILAKESGDLLTGKDEKFLLSRMDKYLQLCEETEIVSSWKTDIESGYMTEGVRDFIKEGQKIWPKQLVIFEKEAQDYVMESINRTGESVMITEQVHDALELGYISEAIADRMDRIISLCDIKSTL